jgi:hypothetical protein
MARKLSDSVGRRAQRGGDGRGLDAKSLEAIGRSLRAHYEDLVRAPIPGKFLEMLDRLEATEPSERQGGGNEGG